jgi:hypothetical protein
MDDETRAFLEAMEGRLMARMNDQHERLADRLTTLAGDVRNLRSEHGVTRDLVSALPATVLGAIEKPLLRRITSVEDRLTRLERPGEAP